MVSIVEDCKQHLQRWEQTTISDMVFDQMLDLGPPALGSSKLEGSSLATSSSPLLVPPAVPVPAIVVNDEGSWSMNSTGAVASLSDEQPEHQAFPGTPMRMESDSQCDLCDYRPKGDPKWFRGSMAKHKKLQHSATTTIYECPFPGCTSKYKNRPDNLRQHQIEKGHFVDDQEKDGERAPKRKRK
jgi:hypothetical protein